MSRQQWGWSLLMVALAALLAVGSVDAAKRHRVRHRSQQVTRAAPPPDEAQQSLEKSLPQNQGLPPLPRMIVSESGFLEHGKVEVLLGLGEHNPTWRLSQTNLQVLPKQFYN